MSLLDEIGDLEALAVEPRPARKNSVPIGKLVADLNQPRKHFDGDELKSLAGSMAERGILQPILVGPEEDGKYVIVAGERRWRAAQIAGLTEVPIVVRDQHDSYDQMIENIQRSDLQHTEIAKWICARIGQGEKAAAIAKRLGRSKAWVSKYSAFGDLPPSVQSRVDQVGMETAQILWKAWKRDAGRTDRFLKTDNDITRGSANHFLDSLSSPDIGDQAAERSSGDTGPQNSILLNAERSHGVHRSDDEFDAEYASAQRNVEKEALGNAGSPKGERNDTAPPGMDIRSSSEQENCSDGMITFEVVRGAETQILRLIINGKTAFEIAEGEKRQVPLSKLI